VKVENGKRQIWAGGAKGEESREVCRKKLVIELVMPNNNALRCNTNFLNFALYLSWHSTYSPPKLIIHFQEPWLLEEKVW